MISKKRIENETKFKNWEIIENDFRKYRLRVNGKNNWYAEYIKIVDPDENTISFYQEIYNEKGILVEIHEKYPIDNGHRKV